MIRLVLFLLFLAALAFGGSWLADRPGEITMVWQGWTIRTTIPVALAVLAVLTALMMLVWRALSLLVRSPRLIAAFSARRRREKGWSAVTQGLLAIGTGDGAGARRARAEAARFLPHEPLTQLLAAQTAQFDGNRELAIAHFRAMADKSNTHLLGLRGLHMEARRAGDFTAAAAFAEEAAAAAPALAWAADAVIEARCADGDFAGARAVLERQMAQKGIDKTQYRRRRAVLLAAEAIALEHADPAVARERAVEAVRLAPTLVPAAACAGRLLGAAGELRKAAKIVETAFAANPHPELAEVDAHLRPGDAALDRLKRIKGLAAKASGSPESAIALARAAIDAHDFRQARLVLEPLLEDPSQRVCLLMAELEAAEHADLGKAREWTAKAVRANRDPAWMADGVVSDHWAPISPISGKLDAFVWAVPPGVSSTPILEHEAERVRVAIAAVRESEEAKAAALAAQAAPPAADVIPPPPAHKAETRPGGTDVAPADHGATSTVANPDALKGETAVSPPAGKAGVAASVAKPHDFKTDGAKPAANATGGVPSDTPKAGAGKAEPSAVVTPLAGSAASSPAAGAGSEPAPATEPKAAGGDEESGVQLQPPAAPAARGDRTVVVAAPKAANDRHRPSRAEPIVAMPPLPDDPGPGADEADEPEPPGRRPRLLEF